MEVVVVLGASSDPSRYSFRALQMLENAGHEAIPVHPRESEILGKKVISSLSALIKNHVKVHTVSVYVNAAISTPLEKDFLALRPDRIIFNPGAENPGLAQSLQKAGIRVENACTLVLLQTDQF